MDATSEHNVHIETAGIEHPAIGLDHRASTGDWQLPSLLGCHTRDISDDCLKLRLKLPALTLAGLLYMVYHRQHVGHSIEWQ